MTYPNFNAIQSFYSLNLWTKDMVGEAVKCKVITSDQYKTITGDDYAAPAATNTDTAQTTTPA